MGALTRSTDEPPNEAEREQQRLIWAALGWTEQHALGIARRQLLASLLWLLREAMARPREPEQNAAAVARGLAGWPARLATMPPDEVSERGRRAANIRWARVRANVDRETPAGDWRTWRAG